MFGKGLKLFTVFGFEVRIDASWLILAILIIVTLTTGHFPRVAEELSTTAYVLMGGGGLIGLFFSIVFHEFWHSMGARSMGIEMRGISLFMFGGIAQIREESHTPKSEFLMAIAGPIASVVLGGVFYGIYKLGGGLAGGLWWCLLGLFLRGISHASYQQVLITQTLKGEKVERLMHKAPVTVRDTVTPDDLVEISRGLGQ